jgi:hypothetical protein
MVRWKLVGCWYRPRARLQGPCAEVGTPQCWESAAGTRPFEADGMLVSTSRSVAASEVGKQGVQGKLVPTGGLPVSTSRSLS